jgi:hypothetical protein
MLISIILNVVFFIVIAAMLIRFRASPVWFSWENIPGTARRIYDNIRRGWNYSDCWSICTTNAAFLIPRLKEFKKNLHGHPIFEDTPEQNGDGEEFDNGMKRWEEMLDKMIFSFECLLNDNEDIIYPHCEFEFVPCKDNPQYSEMVCIGTPEELKKRDEEMIIFREKMKERNKIIQEGLDLFAKYYQNLWD